MVDDNPSIEDETQIQAEQLEHFRSLVVGPTANSVRQLRDELQHRQIDAEKLSRALPSAIRKSAKDKNFARALGPTLSQAFKDSVKNDPEGLVDAIAPIMGPAIRRSISDQIRAMVQSLNTALDHSFSPRGIAWRIEAWRTGTPFAEVVLLHTLVYRIEQLLLIDPETGLLMQSASADPNDDADLVSALLSAIQDFMRDSFEHRSTDGPELQTLNTNELTLLIEHGSRATLAAAVRGVPPISLREKLRAVLQGIHAQHGNLLSTFQGDTAHLDIVQPDLEELLESEFIDKESDSETSQKSIVPGWKRHLRWAMPVCVLMLAMGFLAKRSWDRHRYAGLIDLPPTAKLEVAGKVIRITGSARHDWIAQAKNRMDWLPHFELDVSKLDVSDQDWISFVEALHHAPGIAVTSARREGNKYYVDGWRDQLSDDPAAIMSKFGLSPQSVVLRWEPYRALDAGVSLRRLKKHVSFPATISSELSSDERTLILKGSANSEWLRKLRYAMSLLDMRVNLNISQLAISTE